MGCTLSKKRRRDNNPRVFMVVNLDDQGQERAPGKIEISDTHLTLYQRGKDPIRWPLRSLRRYGFEAELFSFESGRKSPMGPGIYAFRCRRAEALFNLLQECIQRAGQEEQRPGAPQMRLDSETHNSRPASLVESIRATAYDPDESHPYQNGTWTLSDGSPSTLNTHPVSNGPETSPLLIPFHQHGQHEYINCKGMNGGPESGVVVDPAGVNVIFHAARMTGSEQSSIQYAEVQHLDEAQQPGTPNGMCYGQEDQSSQPLYINVPVASHPKPPAPEPTTRAYPIAGNPPCLHKLSSYERPRHYANLALGPPSSSHTVTVRQEIVSAVNPSMNYAELELSNSCDSVIGATAAKVSTTTVSHTNRNSPQDSPAAPRADSYATIDFQRTKAMQKLNTRNSTSNDEECCRKTRHNSEI